MARDISSSEYFPSPSFNRMLHLMTASFSLSVKKPSMAGGGWALSSSESESSRMLRLDIIVESSPKPRESEGYSCGAGVVVPA